jgi:hypothetical protein
MRSRTVPPAVAIAMQRNRCGHPALLLILCTHAPVRFLVNVAQGLAVTYEDDVLWEHIRDLFLQ